VNRLLVLGEGLLARGSDGKSKAIGADSTVLKLHRRTLSGKCGSEALCALVLLPLELSHSGFGDLLRSDRVALAAGVRGEQTSSWDGQAPPVARCYRPHPLHCRQIHPSSALPSVLDCAAQVAWPTSPSVNKTWGKMGSLFSTVREWDSPKLCEKGKSGVTMSSKSCCAFWKPRTGFRVLRGGT
jgi:hypothetical protein